MHPLLRTLDLTASAGTMSSMSSVHELHPIRDHASDGSRAIPLLVSLGLTPLFVYGLSISLQTPSSMQAVNGILDQTKRSITLLLQESDRSNQKPPAVKPLGPEGPGGAGHREGTGTLDPRLAAYTSILSQPSDAIDPEELSTSLKAERVFLSLNPALPLEVGGNGLAKGTGRDSAKGPGGLARPEKAFDFKLIPIHQVQVQHQLTRAEFGVAKESVRILILIGEDGLPFQATVVSGPPYLHQESLKAARQWRFEPLAAHGLTAPISLVITFHPFLLTQR